MNSIRKKPAHVCCVVGCRSDTPGTKFYSFPASKYKIDQRERWIKAVRRINPDGTPWQPTKYSVICSNHFIENAKSEHPLNPSFIPTIFPSVYLNRKKSKSSMENERKRFDRSLKRKKDAVNIKLLHNGNSRSKRAAAQDCPEIQLNNSALVEEPTVDIPVESCSDVGTQVNFLCDSTDFNIFICNRYSNGNVSEAETQASFQPFVSKKQVHKNANTVAHKSCGTDIIYEEKGVGPEPTESEKDLLTCANGFHGIDSIKTNQDMLDLTGVNLETFEFLSKHVDHNPNERLSKENRLLLFLFRMKLGITFSAIGVLFNVHRTTASRSFYSTLQRLTQVCKNLVTWPSKETVRATMPDVFKKSYENCRVIIDCTEIRVEQPPEIGQRVHFYSHYKKGFTVKILVGCTPGGHISFVSECYGGRSTDAQIVNLSGFLNLLEPGDSILADKGFPEIKTALDNRGDEILLVMPPFLRDGHFSVEQVQETQKIASVRIHIERIMARLKSFNILSKFSISMLPYCNDIVLMCCILCNLQPPILKSNQPDD